MMPETNDFRGIYPESAKETEAGSLVGRIAVFAIIMVSFAASRPLHAQVAEVVKSGDAAAVPAATPAAAATPAGGQPAGAATIPPIAVTTIDDKEFKATQIELLDGKLNVKTDPPQSIPLNELQRATISHETKLAVEWLGQQSRDLVGIGSIDEANGIQDIHIRASGLTAKTLTQVSIIARPQFRTWRQNVANSVSWKIATERIGQASVANFYFEPPTKDLFETDLEVTITFDDNSTAKATLKASGHTNDSAKVETPESGATNGNRMASLQFEGGDSLKGRVIEATADHMAVETAWRPSFEVPLLQVRGIIFDGVKPDAKTKYDEHFSKPGEDDYVLVLSKDGGFAEINGRLQSISDSGIKIVYEEQERSIKLDRVQAVVFGSHPATRQWKGPYQSFRFASGDTISAEWQSLAEKVLLVKTAWGTDLELPRESIVEITGRNTKMVNLSEMTPASVEQVPWFDRIIPWIRDKSWNNKPLRLDDKTYNRGLAVHSRCVLTYDLGGEFATFRAVLGFDEEAGDRGRVACRILVDSQELFVKPDFRAGEKAIPVEVAVKGAKQLRLEVDFGEDEDVGDRVIWANARLYRE